MQNTKKAKAISKLFLSRSSKDPFRQYAHFVVFKDEQVNYTDGAFGVWIGGLIKTNEERLVIDKNGVQKAAVLDEPLDNYVLKEALRIPPLSSVVPARPNTEYRKVSIDRLERILACFKQLGQKDISGQK